MLSAMLSQQQNVKQISQWFHTEILLYNGEDAKL